jgi:hypothetical protein
MDSKISRRELALAVTTAATTAAALSGQSQSAQSGPPDELAAVRQQNATNQEVLAKFDVAQAVEPAVHFRA